MAPVHSLGVDFFEAQRRARRRTVVVLVGGALALLLLSVCYGLTTLGVARLAALGRPADLLPFAMTAAAVPVLCALVAGLIAHRRFADGPRGAEVLGARPLSADRPDERVLRNVVEEIAVAAALPAPALFVWDDQPGVNALALGHTPRDGALVFTDQAVGTLSRDALQALAAHEMAHLAAGDTQLNGLLAAVVAGLEAPLRTIWRGTKEVLEDRGASVSDADPAFRGTGAGVDSPVSLTFVLLLVIIFGVPVLIGSPWLFTALAAGAFGFLLLGTMGWLLARLLAISVARQREHHADALALQLTRHPDGLADAIQAVAEAPLRGLILSRHREAVRHFFFGRPDIPSPAWGDALSAHPAMEARLDRIRRAPRPEPAPAPPSPEAPIAPPPAPDPAPTPSVRPTALAAETLAALPPDLLDAAHAPTDAAALLLALATSAPAPLPFLSDAQALDRPRRLALVEVALPALRQLPGAERARLIRSVSAAVHADGHVSPWEHAMLAVLRYGLGTPPRRRRLPDAALGSALWTLLCRIAQGDGVASDAALSRGRAIFRRASLAVPDGSGSAPDAGTFDEALDRLATALPEQQRLALEMTDAAVHADGRVTEDEGDLTCALALALGQPLPGWATGTAAAPQTA
jgi:Zn-dependent protease with chaperone function